MLRTEHKKKRTGITSIRETITIMIIMEQCSEFKGFLKKYRSRYYAKCRNSAQTSRNKNVLTLDVYSTYGTIGANQKKSKVSVYPYVLRKEIL